MAYLPCSMGKHRHPGRNTNLYVGVLSHGDPLRGSGRLCPVHWREVQNSLSQFEVDTESGTLSDPSFEGLCLTCLKPVHEGGSQVFLTSYPAKNERKDYWARLHESCDLDIPFLTLGVTQ